jgi:hypothetical protein
VQATVDGDYGWPPDVEVSDSVKMLVQVIRLFLLFLFFVFCFLFVFFFFFFFFFEKKLRKKGHFCAES